MTSFRAIAKAFFYLSLAQSCYSADEAKYLKQSCINHDCSAKRITLSNPPVNLWDVNIIRSFNTLMKNLNGQNDTKVVVFDSDTSDFWAAALDINLFVPGAIPGVNSSEILDTYYLNLDHLLSTPVIFIGEVNGRAWGAGDEHLLRMDMRFAGPNAQFGAPEASLGLIHVGALQQLTRLIGPGRTAEYMLSSAQVSASEAARVGWVNSVFPTAKALHQHVDNLATRISLFPIEAIRATKASIAEQAPSKSMFENDLARFNQLAALPRVLENVKKVIQLSHNQSKAWEENNNDNIVRYIY